MSHLALKQAGLSLVELMIALTLGLLVTAAVAFVVTSQSQTREHNQGISEAQETARLALEILSSDIAQAGYFGDFGNLRLRHEAVRYRATPTAMTPPAVAPDCTATGTTNSGSFPAASGTLQANLPFRVLWFGRAAISPLSCVTALPNTDLLQIKRLLASEVANAAAVHDANQFYAMTNFQQLLIYPGSNVAADNAVTNGRRFPYTHRVYYIANAPVDGQQVPSLFRRELRASGASGSMSDPQPANKAAEPLLTGVEHVRYFLGIDSNGDQQADRFVRAADMTNLMWDDIGDSVVSVRIVVLARALRPDPLFTNEVSFDLGDANRYQPGADGIRRVLLSGVVKVRSQI